MHLFGTFCLFVAAVLFFLAGVGGFYAPPAPNTWGWHSNVMAFGWFLTLVWVIVNFGIASNGQLS